MDPWIGDIEQETLGNDTFGRSSSRGAHAAHRHEHRAGRRYRRGSSRRARPVHPDRVGLARRARRQRGQPSEVQDVGDDWAVIIPSGTWHNVVNTGTGPQGLSRSTRRPSIPTGPSTGRRRMPRLPSAEHSLGRLRRAGLGEAPATSLEVERDVRREAVALEVLHDGRSMPSGARQVGLEVVHEHPRLVCDRA